MKTHSYVIHATSRRRDIFHGNNANPLDEVFPNQCAAFAVVGKKIEIGGWNDRPVFLSGCPWSSTAFRFVPIILRNEGCFSQYVMTDLPSSASRSRSRIIAYWVTTALLVSELVLGGVWDILRAPQVRGLIERLGYPLYFLVILGIWKLLGAVALVIPRFPRLKEWAYAGVFFDLTGAVASQLASGLMDAGTMAFPIVMTGVAVASWALRPPSRRLAPG